MLTELRLTNFKAFGETQRIPIKPLTLIFGANSSGKSSIIHSLLLAHHGLESGRLDAHQTALGGESVDLGGFRSYVHRHEANRRVSLHIEKPAAERTVWERLRDPWRVAVGAAKRVGVTFHIGQDERTAKCDSSSAQPVVLGLEVLVNGRCLLEFERNEAGAFVVKTVDVDHPYLEAILRPLLAHSIEESLKIKMLEVNLPLDGDLPVSWENLSAEEKQDVEKKNQERIKANPFLSRLALARTDEKAAEAELWLLKETLAKILGERKHHLDGLVLKDPDPDPWWEWVGWQYHMEEEQDPVSFLRKHSSDWGTPDSWWAEAQAVRYDLNKLLAGRFKQIRDDLRQLCYLGPLRCVPSRHVTSVRDQDPNWLASGGVAWEMARKDAEVVDAVNRWLGPGRLDANCRLVRKLMVDTENLLAALRDQPAPAALGSGAYAAVNQLLQQSVELSPVAELLFEDVNTRTTLSHRDIGFGVSQVLPVLVSSLASRERLIAIEQPELHLHPALQAELGDVFIESALGERKNTFLLETHSEHLILRILRRIRETTEGKNTGLPPIQPKDVSVLYVQPGPNGAEVIELPVTPDGDFDRPWPRGFFAERFQELP